MMKYAFTYLQKIGCDRPINYNKENLKDVLKREYSVSTRLTLWVYIYIYIYRVCIYRLTFSKLVL